MDDLIQGAEAISLFCRMNINVKRDLPIRASEMGLLIFLVKSENSVTSIQAAEFFGVSKPLIAVMLIYLDKKVFITRGAYENDRRRFTLLPTDKGVALVEKTYCEYYKMMEVLRNGMGSQDYSQLIELIGKANTVILEEKEKWEKLW